jgi:antitoxin component YwqK of YwqJK toxin-antitoxin module
MAPLRKARPWASCLALAALAGCRAVVESAYPDGKPKVERTYNLFGPKDSANLKRERTWYFNGKPEKDARYRRGILHGPYRDFWHNGQLRNQGEYVDGRRQGPWKVHFNQFTVASQGSYLDGLKEGEWIDSWENGDLKARGEFRRGREVGTWRRWASRGDLVEETSCFEANDTGRYASYHADRTPKEEYRCRRGKPVGGYVRLSLEGEVEQRGRYDSAGRKDGLWETFHPGGKPASRHAYRAGVQVDSLWAWDRAGRVRERGFLVDGAGEKVAYDSLGKVISRMRISGGKPDGESWSYYPDGKRMSLVVYGKGQPVLNRKWHPNGRLAQEGAFEEGKRDGEWKRFGEAGQPLETTWYRKGIYHGERKLYDSTGRLIQVLRYEHGYPAEGRFPAGLKGSGRGAGGDG